MFIKDLFITDLFMISACDMNLELKPNDISSTEMGLWRSVHSVVLRNIERSCEPMWVVKP